MQYDSESLYETWEQFKEMLQNCAHYGLPKWLQAFYNRLQGNIQTIIDAAVGPLIRKSIDYAYVLLEEMASNNYKWPFEIFTPKKEMCLKWMPLLF